MSSIPKSIENRLSSLFTKQISNKACDVYSRLDIKIVPRDKNRDKILCYCVYQAHIELGIYEFDMIDLGKKFKITLPETKAAINSRPKYKHGVKPSTSVFSHINMMKSYCLNIMLMPDEIVSQMEVSFKNVLFKNKSLLLEQAKYVVIAFIFCYFDMNGFDVNKEEVCFSASVPLLSVNYYIDDIRDALIW
jgi:hypothetical protein